MTLPNVSRNKPVWREYFDDREDYLVKLRFYECLHTTTLEEMYQMFKERMEWEEDQKHD